MQLQLTLALAFLAAGALAWKCTEGTPWTPEELHEYLTLNDTTNWAPMAKMPQCTPEASELLAANETSTLEARRGGNKFIAYGVYHCGSNVLFSADNFCCGGCYSVSRGIYSGLPLARED
ncbi:hypothetical protein B0T26DRAFT_749244 [Lasiosphaeria miniovina]|uniref:Uncharacterized protein n=1 Tax=Lasiosphaeria miniovina TaxID=1954250 RepID=A0AA40E408_9PEZI|nr:uncharacterized protein B0T26DRAFT_749244 [Lasiosphaeria miniovina]KAK0721758.1 hypothetical protein B0T26DRAFT_749244 [Lasiosphaeria miniovina]